MPASAMLFCWRPVVAEQLRRAHAGVEQDELVAHVDDRRVLFEHDIVLLRKLSVSIFCTSSLGTPTNVPEGSPSGKASVGDNGDFRAA
jgi:hypothetical protein